MQNSVLKSNRHELWGKFIKAIHEFDMVQPNDCIAVCISGGKDSMLLGLLFKTWLSFSDIPFTVRYIVMDPGYKPLHRQQIIENAKCLDLAIEIFDITIFSVAEQSEKSPCYLCARMRRGSLYQFAQSLGCNKIALGHHYDDVIETIMMNLFYGGKVGTMLPRLKAQNYDGMELIRPLYYVREKSVINWAKRNDLKFLDCACIMSDKRAHESKRAEVKRLIKELSKDNPFLEANLFKSVEHVNLNKVVSYYDDDVEEVHFMDKLK